ncbi:MAG: alpha/beta fold hydrolase [Acidimicrobiales bacterium]
MPTSLLRRTAATLALALTVTACGSPGTTPTADAPPPSTTTRPARPTTLVDDTFPIEGGRLRLHCEGEGPSTVLLLAGWDAGGDEAWASVQPSLSQQARVCTYDRFGTGSSDQPATVQTFRSQVSDLHELLEVAGEPGPYVVVGHSFGGAQAVTFAADHREQVAGLLLVDATPTSWPAAVCAVPDDGTPAARSYLELCSVMHDSTRAAERLDVVTAFDLAADIATLGAMPMTVVTATHRTSPGLPPQQLSDLDTAWTTGTERWADLSTCSTVLAVDDTSHYIQIDHPDLILDSIAALLRRPGCGPAPAVP